MDNPRVPTRGVLSGETSMDGGPASGESTGDAGTVQHAAGADAGVTENDAAAGADAAAAGSDKARGLLPQGAAMVWPFVQQFALVAAALLALRVASSAMICESRCCTVAACTARGSGRSVCAEQQAQRLAWLRAHIAATVRPLPVVDDVCWHRTWRLRSSRSYDQVGCAVQRVTATERTTQVAALCLRAADVLGLTHTTRTELAHGAQAYAAVAVVCFLCLHDAMRVQHVPRKPKPVHPADTAAGYVRCP